MADPPGGCEWLILLVMLYRRLRRRSLAPHGFYRFESQSRRLMYGVGDGEFVRLVDEFGNIWRGQAESCDDKTIRFIFRDSAGGRISGISDSGGVTLRDERGHTWRGYID